MVASLSRISVLIYGLVNVKKMENCSLTIKQENLDPKVVFDFEKIKLHLKSWMKVKHCN